MSDNEDLLGDDLGDQSLADYNLGNEEEEQLLADDYENGTQNVPVSRRDEYAQSVVPLEYPTRVMEYVPQVPYGPVADTESVVPNITVEVPNVPHSTYPPAAPEPRHYEAEHAVPPAMPAMPMESPQIVPSEIPGAMPNGEMPRERFVSERPLGAQRLPQVRDIPDSLDKVVIPRGGFARGRGWRAPYRPRHVHPYSRNYGHRGNFSQRSSFPSPQIVRPNLPPPIRPDIRPDMMRPDIRPEQIRPDNIPLDMRPDNIPPDMRPDINRPEMRPDLRPDMRPDIRPDMRPDIRPDMRPDLRPDMMPPEMHLGPSRMGPEISPERPILPEMFRPNRFPPFNRFELERPHFNPARPQFERPMYPYPRQFGPRFAPREIVPNAISHIPQVTIRQAVPNMSGNMEPEVRMLPVQLPHLPPAGLAGKKVLINPHFKGNFQPPVEGLPVYIPTRIQKSPPLSPQLEKKFGPIKDIDDAAERFIAEQRNALARAASRKFSRRSPQRYIENTTIEIANELAPRTCTEEEDLLRRQEQFINDNRAGLRRRMRSPSPVVSRRSPSPRRRPDSPRHHDEECDYKRRLREQETLRERVLRAKEVRRRKNAINKLLEDKERENQEKAQPPKEPAPKTEPSPKEPERPATPEPRPEKPKAEKPKLEKSVVEKPKLEKPVVEAPKPDTTRKTPERRTPEIEVKDKRRKSVEDTRDKEKVRERSPVKPKDDEVNSTCEGLTPPWKGTSDDELDLILGDIDGFLSDDDDSGRFKHKPNQSPPTKCSSSDLRSKLPPRDNKRQKIVFDDKDDKRKRDKTPPRRALVSSTKADEDNADKKSSKAKAKQETSTNKSRQRITFGNKDKEQDKDKEKEKEKDKQEKTPPFSNRRVILQRKTAKDKPLTSAGIFGRTVRNVFGDKKKHEPKVEIESDSEVDEDRLLGEESGNVAEVTNLPHGMTDTRLRTLAGSDVQSLSLDKEERSAKVTFKTTAAAEHFKKKFNNKMVAASRLSVSLR